MRYIRRNSEHGTTLFEVALVIAITGVVLGGALIAFSGIRAKAHCLAVGQHMRGIHAALELYFNKYRQYPPETVPLKTSLAEFIKNPAVWADPADRSNGDVVSSSYHAPSGKTVVSAKVLGSPCGGMKYVTLYSNGLVKIQEVEAKCPEVGDTGASSGESGGSGGSSGGGTPSEPPVTVTDGGATFKECKAYVRVVGTDFTYSDGTHVYSAATAFLDGTPKLVGDPALVGTGFEQDVAEGTRVTVRCEIKDAYVRQCWQANGWPVLFTSDDHSGQCLTVVRGNQVPVYAPGYPCQQPVHVLLSEYVNAAGVVTIKDNEVLWLFDENYVGDDPQKLDYNDLVVLATARARSGSGGGEAEPAEPPPVASNTDSAGFTVVLKNKLENADGTLSLVWTITSDSSSSTPALSYVVFDLPSTTRTLAKNTAWNSLGKPMSIVNPDSSTGARGLKVSSLTLGSGGAVQTLTVAFKVWTGTTAVTVKTRTSSSTGTSTFGL